MAEIVTLKDIKAIVKVLDVAKAMEKAFIQYSIGQAVVPPVGELLFERPPGDVHIKYGYIKNDDFYVIKIASGFYENPKLGISSSQGMMLLFSQKTGQPKAILLDEGYLTDIRTAAAGALAAQYFAPKKIKAIGVIGTGIQAKLQLEFMQKENPCRTVWVWGRTEESITNFISELNGDFTVHVAQTPSEVAQNCNLIVTTTPSQIPLLKAEDILQGTHITAVGSDVAEKQELDSKILQKADLVIADSMTQSESRGEIYRSVKDGAIHREKVVELGTAIQTTSLQRKDDTQISVVDLTGVAVQDIMIAKEVYHKYLKITK